MMLDGTQDIIWGGNPRQGGGGQSFVKQGPNFGVSKMQAPQP